MTIYGNSKQNGTPTPENPKEIKSKPFIYGIDRNGKKIKIPFNFKCELKEDDRFEKFGDEWYLVRKE